MSSRGYLVNHIPCSSNMVFPVASNASTSDSSCGTNPSGSLLWRNSSDNVSSRGDTMSMYPRRYITNQETTTLVPGPMGLRALRSVPDSYPIGNEGAFEDNHADVPYKSVVCKRNRVAPGHSWEDRMLSRDRSLRTRFLISPESPSSCRSVPSDNRNKV